MQSLFPSAAARSAQGTNLLQFPAGKCILTQLPNGKYQVTADMRSGQIQLSKGQDGLLHFKWFNVTTSTVEDDRMVMGGDCKFKKVNTGRTNQPNDRVYMLKFSGNPKPLMFWMQDVDASKDEERISKTNALLDNPSANIGGTATSVGAPVAGLPANLMQLLGRQPPVAPPATAGASVPSSSTATLPPSATGNAPFGNLDLSSLIGNLNNNNSLRPASTAVPAAPAAPRIPATPALQHIFSGEEVSRTGLLTDPVVVGELLPHLPADQQTPDHLARTLRSAQLTQSMGSLTSALRNPDNFQSVLSNFQLNVADGHEQIVRGDGVGAFLSAIQASVDRETAANNADNSETATNNGDTNMDTDEPTNNNNNGNSAE